MQPESRGFEIRQFEQSGSESASHVPDAATGEGRLREIETHAKRLFTLVNDLRSMTDRACDAALREAEYADRIEADMKTELTDLQGELKQKEELLSATELALTTVEQTSRAQAAEFERLIQQKESQLNSREIQWRELTSEKENLVCRLNAAELAAVQAESQARQLAERVETELDSLRLEINQREESLAARELHVSRIEADLKANIHNLQRRLDESEAKLAHQEKENKQKDRVIEAAGRREAEIARLIERLSSECERLSAELCEKTLTIERLGDRTRYLSNSGKAFKKVLGLGQEKPV